MNKPIFNIGDHLRVNMIYRLLTPFYSLIIKDIKYDENCHGYQYQVEYNNGKVKCESEAYISEAFYK